MKFFVTNPNNDFAETPVQEEGRIIHHLHLAKGKEVPEHSADALVTVVCLSGDVSFSAGEQTVRLVAGSLFLAKKYFSPPQREKTTFFW